MSIPPIPTRDESDDNSGILMAVIPSLARVLIELPREHQRLVSFHPFCPARTMLERIVGQEIVRATSKADRERFIWLARLTGYALEVADETHQLDGKSALDFASGFVQGELSIHDLFVGEEGEEQALSVAIDQAPLRAGSTRPFVLGFQTRRDQRRTALADGKESA